MLERSAVAIALPVFGLLIVLSEALTAVWIAEAKSAPVFNPPVELPLTSMVKSADALTPSKREEEVSIVCGQIPESRRV